MFHVPLNIIFRSCSESTDCLSVCMYVCTIKKTKEFFSTVVAKADTRFTADVRWWSEQTG